MKKLLTFFLIAIIGITITANAFGKDVKTATKPAAPTIISAMGSWYHDTVTITASGATSIEDRYYIYYADYNGDDRKKSWKWLKENGKLLSDNYTWPNELTMEATLRCDNPNGSQQVFTVTIVDKNGKESDPAPIQIK